MKRIKKRFRNNKKSRVFTELRKLYKIIKDCSKNNCFYCLHFIDIFNCRKPSCTHTFIDLYITKTKYIFAKKRIWKQIKKDFGRLV